MCEWKGTAEYFDVVAGGGRVERGAWCYPEPHEAFESIRDWVAFYPAQLECLVDDEPVEAQEGGFYGGWITSDLVGPFKGAPGTAGW